MRAEFVERPNRFLVKARLGASGEIIAAHCPDPGRLRELLIPGAAIYVSEAGRTARKTQYDLRFVEHPQNGQLVSLDSRLPNRLFWHELHRGRIPRFDGFQSARREVRLPQSSPQSTTSRIDFLVVDHDGRDCWVEVKSATLVERRAAKFPDAPTTRGRRHVLELAHRIQNTDDRAVVVFVVQRPDADSLSPNWGTDRQFGESLAYAADAGVELYAFTCLLTTYEISLSQEIRVIVTDGI
jgi:sugar fermentation stimulation protein A